MSKKIILGCLVIVLLFLNSYQIYTLQEQEKQIKILETSLLDKKSEEEYLSLYQELEQEIGEVSDIEVNIEDKIGLLKREVKENEEGITLSIQDLENIKAKNNEVEQQIIILEQQKKEQEKKEQENTKKNSTFPVMNQFPNYPTGCESVSLYLLLQYYEVDVSLEDIISNLKKGSLPYKNNGQVLGGNPEVEFIGNPKTNYSYGVYNEPIKEVANQYKAGVVSKTGLDFSEVLKLVENKHPVMVWTTINLSKPFVSISWIYPKTGEEIQWLSGEHAMVIFDTEENKVIASDPYTGTIRHFDKETFHRRYNDLGKRVIYYA